MKKDIQLFLYREYNETILLSDKPFDEKGNLPPGTSYLTSNSNTSLLQTLGLEYMKLGQQAVITIQIQNIEQVIPRTTYEFKPFITTKTPAGKAQRR